jgi:hypothetical protein
VAVAVAVVAAVVVAAVAAVAVVVAAVAVAVVVVVVAVVVAVVAEERWDMEASHQLRISCLFRHRKTHRKILPVVLLKCRLNLR